jgi:hypothetical protein
MRRVRNLLLAVLLPCLVVPGVIWLARSGLGLPDALPPITNPPGDASLKSADALVALSDVLVSLTLSLVVFVGFLARGPRGWFDGMNAFDGGLVVAFSITATLSIYFGYFLRIGLIQQIYHNSYNLRLLQPRLAWQAAFLLGSFTIALSVLVRRAVAKPLPTGEPW